MVTVDEMKNLDIKDIFNIDTINKESEKEDLGGSTIVDFSTTDLKQKKNNSKIVLVGFVLLTVIVSTALLIKKNK